MKNNYKVRTLITALILISALAAVAQHDTIANGGFETWTSSSGYSNPNNWNTDNSLTYVGGLGSAVVFKETTAAHVHSGLASAELKTASIFGQIGPGTITTGVVSSSGISGGCAINYRPDKFKGWFQFAPQSATDTFVVSLALYTGNTYAAPIGTANFTTTSTVSTWTKWDLPIIYTGAGTPDSMQIIIASGTGNNSTSGTIAYVDDVALVDCSLMSVSATPSAATCTQSNGSAVAAATGGASPYTYLWSNSATSASISSLAATSYTVVATDAEGCSATASATVTTSNVPFTVTPTNGTTNCGSNTGTVSVTATNGNSPYTYLWADNATTSQISNLGSGSYNITVTDNHGCTSTATASVVTPGGPSATDTVKNLACNNDNSGGIAITVSGGAIPITYSWSNAATTESLTGVAAGTYTLTITDHNNCTFEVSATLTQPTALTATDAVTNVSCFGGSNGAINVTPSGGTLPYSYNWGGNTGSNLTAGNYSVTITDANGCTFDVSAAITQPASAVAATQGQQNVSCNGGNDGSASVTVSGGTTPYQYAWTNSSTTSLIGNLAAGNYSVTVTDNNACTTISSFAITQPTAVTAVISTTPASTSTASDGSATVTASGGTTPYTYAWTTSGTHDSIANVAPATYCVTVTDANSCTANSCDSVGYSVGIQSISAGLISIYPNPVNSQVNIVTNSATGKYQFGIYSLDGKLVVAQTITGEKSTIFLDQLADGLYTYQLKDVINGGVNYGKLQILR